MLISELFVGSVPKVYNGFKSKRDSIQDESGIVIVPGLPKVQKKPREYEIEPIVRWRYRKKRLEYLIRWKGFTKSKSTWEPQVNLNAEAREYLIKNPVKISG